MANQHKAVIVSACRTAIARLVGSLVLLPAPWPGAIALREAIQRACIGPAIVDETFIGCVVLKGMTSLCLGGCGAVVLAAEMEG